MAAQTLPDVIYGRKFGMALTMDIVRPPSPSGVGVIALSSGGWKSFPEMGKPPTEEFVRRGQTVFSVCHGSRPRFAIAEIVKDIQRAIRYARLHARSHGVDPNRLGLFGISSGGNISLLTASQGSDGNPAAEDPLDRQSDRVGAVACFYPPTDFGNFGEPGKVWIPYRGPEEQSTDAEFVRANSPVTYFTPAMPPTLLIHGDADVQVPIQQSQSAIEKLKALGVKTRLETRPGKAHGWPGVTVDNDICAEWFDAHLSKT